MPRLWVLTVAVFCVVAGAASADGQVVTAHRGASYDAPENTLVAFRLAWDQQADAIEGDFRLTADGRIVCIHDADTQRTCGVKHVVAETALDDLRRLDFGCWKAPSFVGEPCCTFEEVMATVPPGKRFFVELKTGPEIVEPLGRIIASDRIDPASLVLIAFDEKTIAACKAQLPHVKAHWVTSFRETRKGSGEWVPSAEQVAETVRRSGADGVGLQGKRQVIDRGFVDRLRAGGVDEFHVWTVDSPDDARLFAQLGALGITTNRPAFIREALGALQPQGTPE